MRLSERYKTPYVALLAQGIWASLLISIPGSGLSQLFNYFGFASWLFYALTAISAIVLRYKQPYCDFERPFRMVREHAIDWTYHIACFAYVARIDAHPKADVECAPDMCSLSQSLSLSFPFPLSFVCARKSH